MRHPEDEGRDLERFPHGWYIIPCGCIFPGIVVVIAIIAYLV